MIKSTPTNIPEVKIIEPVIYDDERGFFFESFHQSNFNKAIGLNVKFIQDNHSKSTYGVLRGLHFQSYPYEQGKLVRVVSGEIFDIAVDVRKKSKTFGHYVGVYLSSSNKKQLWIPEGFAHGFLVTSRTADLVYKTTNYYCKDHEKSIKYNDKDLCIKWPKLKTEFILSPKDSNGMTLENLKNFLT